MKSTLTLLLLIFNLNWVQQQNNLKEMLQGKWQLKTNKKETLSIKNNIIEHFYKGKLVERNHLEYNFQKSETSFFDIKTNSFNFQTKAGPEDAFKLLEYNSEGKPIENIILYVDKKNLEIGYDAGFVSFKKIK